MPPEAHAFLAAKNVGVIALVSDGAPHAATVHFAYAKDPLTFIFLTDVTTKKGAMLQAGTLRASLVIGTDETTMQTLQLDGTAALMDDESLKETYFSKFPKKKEQYDGPDDIFFAFTPTWWRYTDYKAPGGKLVLTS